MASLKLIPYPHPTLRHRSKPIVRVDQELKNMIDEMFEIMYEFRGVGLAANQVNLPIRLFIANPSGDKVEGPEMVFINPVISKGKGTADAEEGCLSLPGVNAQVKRNKSLHINAYSMDGTEINTEVDGFLARIIQHEVDHLDGVLFIDRLSDEIRRPIADQIAKFENSFDTRRKSGEVPSDEALREQIVEFEKKYCL
jgi:peptide deformylase